jgi:two-component system heavy metal sensor histidine kinase CusS
MSTMTFQRRVFLVVAAVVALALLGAALVGWLQAQEVEHQRLDERLCAEARRLAREPASRRSDADSTERLAGDMANKLGVQAAQELKLSAWREGALARRWPLPELGFPESLKWPAASGLAAPHPLAACALTQWESSGKPWRAARVQQELKVGMVAADSQAASREWRAALAQSLVGSLPLAALLTALAAAFISRYALAPVHRLQEAMRAVTPSALSQRLSAQAQSPEFQELTRAYNTMLERLEASFHQASRFSADAAHELKTPLTILQTRLERTLTVSDHLQARVAATPGQMGAQPELDELHHHILTMLDEVSRLSGITRKLLLLSQADAGQLPLHLERFDLSALLQDGLQDASMALEERSLRAHLPPVLWVEADVLLMRQLLNNLLSNALRYAPPRTAIEVSAGSDAQGAWVEVSNPCEPLPRTQRQRLFERFYRSDTAHSRVLDGCGLGLAISREITKAHSGKLELMDSSDDCFRIRLTLPQQTRAESGA